MQPKTKLQLRVVELAKTLTKITNHQQEWAFKECLSHKGYATKNRVLCLDCGETFPPSLVKRKKAICPHCDTKIQVKESRNTTDTQTNYFAITNVVEEFQVIRNFEIIANYKKGNPATYFIKEIIQYWIQPDLKTTMYGLKRNYTGFMNSCSGEMEIRQNPKFSYYGNPYDVYVEKYHETSIIKPEYKKFGINHNLKGLSFSEAIKLIPKTPKLETLIKSKQYELLKLGNSYRLDVFWKSIKICIRNKYFVKDHITYLDYLELLRYFKKDLCNSKYVCPKNLNKEHDRLVEKKRIYQKKIDLERRKKEIQEDDLLYKQEKEMFFNLKIKSKNIEIVPLKSVQDFIDEGDALKHCLFANNYQRKSDSLVLSARIKNKPIETIEVSLNEFQVLQSRGFQNKPTKQHEQIVELITKNMHLISAIYNQNKL